MKKMLTCTLLQALTVAPLVHAEEKSVTEKVSEKIEELTGETTKVESEKKEEIKAEIRAPSNLKVETIAFASGVSSLSDEDKGKLKAFIEDAVASGTIKDIKVASWSDNEVPQDPTKSLSKEDRRLAEERAENTRKYLRDQLKMKKIEIYNMAHGTNRLAKAFRTEEAELRTAFAGKDAAPGKLRPEVLAIRDHGKASTVVLVVEFKELKSK